MSIIRSFTRSFAVATVIMCLGAGCEIVKPGADGQPDTSGVNDLVGLKTQLENAGSTYPASAAAGRAEYDRLQTNLNAYLESIRVEVQSKGDNILWPFSQVDMSHQSVSSTKNFQGLDKAIADYAAKKNASPIQWTQIALFIWQDIQSLYKDRADSVKVLTSQLKSAQSTTSWDQLKHQGS